MLVGQEATDEGRATVWVLLLDGYTVERLCIVSHQASVADTCARGKDEFVFGVTVRDLVLDKAIRGVIVVVNIFPSGVVVGLVGCVGWIGWGEIIIIRDLELVDFGIVSDLAMALVEHVFANGLQGVAFPAFSAAVYAHIADGDLFDEIADEAVDVDEIVCVGDEERVGGGHVGEIILEGWEGEGAEETGGDGEVGGRV